MSILIKGMKMPKEHNWITVRIYPNGICACPNWQGDCKIIKGVNAVEIPPHGRLIDADALTKRATTVGETNDLWDYYPQSTQDFVDYVNDAPTVIESEDE